MYCHCSLIELQNLLHILMGEYDDLELKFCDLCSFHDVMFKKPVIFNLIIVIKSQPFYINVQTVI